MCHLELTPESYELITNFFLNFRDTRRCIRYLAFWGRHNHFVFIGDSRILDIYTGFLDHLTGRDTSGSLDSLTPRSSQAYQNNTFSDSQLRVTVDFIWSPYISDEMVNSFKKWEVRW
jgi:hypothetical protein